VREQETLQTYQLLMQKKQALLKLISDSYNRQQAHIDIGLSEEFDELKRIIDGQELTIQQLRGEIGRQGKRSAR
jgi:hypothetical protein